MNNICSVSFPLHASCLSVGPLPPARRPAVGPSLSRCVPPHFCFLSSHLVSPSCGTHRHSQYSPPHRHATTSPRSLLRSRFPSAVLLSFYFSFPLSPFSVPCSSLLGGHSYITSTRHPSQMVSPHHLRIQSSSLNNVVFLHLLALPPPPPSTIDIVSGFRVRVQTVLHPSNLYLATTSAR